MLAEQGILTPNVAKMILQALIEVLLLQAFEPMPGNTGPCTGARGADPATKDGYRLSPWNLAAGGAQATR